MELLFEKEVYKIIGAAIEVHRELGPGFLEAVYEEAMEIESSLRDIPFKTQKELKIFYKERKLEKKYKADYIAWDKIVVEFKCIPKLTSKEEAQILNYLKATKLKLGLLINFGSSGRLEWKRYINTKRTYDQTR
ncbi:MAG: GxxExxY protein [Calditrichaeota bacterium]|nr:MAG: GxxExxY protein [Calditrichota bacterium]MBL1205710.1 GxxExxY protein [Calditrichota bacterium]NOG45538.1 GxxExxY protein [Calditrichota bacterium]